MKSALKIAAPLAAMFGMAPAAALAQTAIMTDDAALRAGPSFEYPRVAYVPEDARVRIHGCVRGFSWCDISWRGDRGWVDASSLSYSWNNRYVVVEEWGPRIGLPVIAFSVQEYWTRHYRDRPWWNQRYTWFGRDRDRGDNWRDGDRRREGGRWDRDGRRDRDDDRRDRMRGDRDDSRDNQRGRNEWSGRQDDDRNRGERQGRRGDDDQRMDRQGQAGGELRGGGAQRPGGNDQRMDRQGQAGGEPRGGGAQRQGGNDNSATGRIPDQPRQGGQGGQRGERM